MKNYLEFNRKYLLKISFEIKPDKAIFCRHTLKEHLEVISKEPV